MAKSKRVKSDKLVLFNIPDLLHADDYVRRVGECQAEIKQLENETKKKIDKLKAGLQIKVTPLQKNIKLYVDSLELYAKACPELFKKSRSIKLDFGKMGWHKSTSVSIKKTTLALIKKVFNPRRRKQFILIKESVSKDALAQLTDEQLAKVGARRVVKDDFFVEPHKTEAANHNNE